MRILLITMSLFLAQVSYGQLAKMQWYTFEEAVELNKKTPKKFFFDIYTDWCGWCKELDRTTFADPNVAAYMNEHYYAIKFNAEKHDTIFHNNKKYFVSRKYHSFGTYLNGGKRISGYPTVSFLDEKINVLFPVNSYLKAGVFLQIAKYANLEAFRYVDFERWKTKPDLNYWKEKVKEDRGKLNYLKTLQVGTDQETVISNVGQPSKEDSIEKDGRTLKRITYLLGNQKVELYFENGKVVAL